MAPRAAATSVVAALTDVTFVDELARMMGIEPSADPGETRRRIVDTAAATHDGLETALRRRPRASRGRELAGTPARGTGGRHPPPDGHRRLGTGPRQGATVGRAARPGRPNPLTVATFRPRTCLPPERGLLMRPPSSGPASVSHWAKPDNSMPRPSPGCSSCVAVPRLPVIHQCHDERMTTTPGPRAEGAGQRKGLHPAMLAALWTVSNGRCYAPGCVMPVVLEVRPGTYQKNSQVAHIFGVRPGAPATAPRYRLRSATLSPTCCCSASHITKKSTERTGTASTRRTPSGSGRSSTRVRPARCSRI